MKELWLKKEGGESSKPLDIQRSRSPRAMKLGVHLTEMAMPLIIKNKEPDSLSPAAPTGFGNEALLSSIDFLQLKLKFF